MPLLKDIDLINCAKANAAQGIVVAAKLCGYEQDINAFERELQQACQKIGVNINNLSDLITEQETVSKFGGFEISPRTSSDL